MKKLHSISSVTRPNVKQTQNALNTVNGKYRCEIAVLAQTHTHWQQACKKTSASKALGITLNYVGPEYSVGKQ